MIRAAAFEPRITHVAAFDILDDEFEAGARQIRRGAGVVLRMLVAAHARRLINSIAYHVASLKPVTQWALQQGMHITGAAGA
ncbi:hypothetical protein [Candidatus Mycobacterium methanotrophicum]|uniref:Uncharacterized protein n=1 Tax=Candidatus Mycobacterium methanotrophicum TaxID=2943498 RepID=A0ABY4QMV4_9MYCO|nr:hypothetical protein [Candidatus Mycobacterium methanotrophicum]UQX11181.1 hypothetical protein M5I08_01045 [Candidatus Mycobacterium methanotrophicum]